MMKPKVRGTDKLRHRLHIGVFSSRKKDPGIGTGEPMFLSRKRTGVWAACIFAAVDLIALLWVGTRLRTDVDGSFSRRVCF